MLHYTQCNGPMGIKINLLINMLLTTNMISRSICGVGGYFYFYITSNSKAYRPVTFQTFLPQKDQK